jgi:tetratricopeptide (TPR) repeat protein
MELLSFLYSATDLSILEKRKRYLKNALNSVFNLDNDTATTLVTAAIYDIAANRTVDIDIVESVFQMPENLNDEYKCLLYRAIIGRSYSLLQKHEEALKSYSKALDINPNDADAWNNKGLALESLGRLGDAIKSYTKALDIDPNDADAWFNRGLAFQKLLYYYYSISYLLCPQCYLSVLLFL